MRKVRFQEVHPTGGLFPEEEKSLLEFLEASGLLRYSNRVPPLSVLNEYIAQGENDMGMGGGAVWKPFEINEKDYEDLMANVGSATGASKEEVEAAQAPSDVKTLSQWRAWIMHVECGCNYQELAPVMEKYDALIKAIGVAMRNGDKALVDRLQDEKAPVLDELERLLKNE